ncbi:MAG: hypothetical protein H7A37_08805 [Chlamydiales bacterium]|nr:hypothetical protein [Chlamydiia bacterium]MCP5508379.1 hypothetical protein [Chlamydiales bacterium]
MMKALLRSLLPILFVCTYLQADDQAAAQSNQFNWPQPNAPYEETSDFIEPVHETQENPDADQVQGTDHVLEKDEAEERPEIKAPEGEPLYEEPLETTPLHESPLEEEPINLDPLEEENFEEEPIINDKPLSYVGHLLEKKN